MLNLKTNRVGLLQISQMHYFFDSAFPAGSYSHSFGFETFAASPDGTCTERAIEWVQSYLVFSLWYGDLENISKVRKASFEHGINSSQIPQLDKRLHASRSTAEARKSARSLSSSMLVAARRLFEGDNFHFKEHVAPLEPSTFVAKLSSELAWDEEYTRLLYLQSQALSATSVLVRYGRIGQFAQLAMMADLLRLATTLASRRPPYQADRGNINAWIVESAQIDHQVLSPRLFQS